MNRSRQLLESILGELENRPFDVRLPDGSRIKHTAADQPAFTIVLNKPSALRSMFLPPSELAMGEGYIFNDVDITGDLVRAFAYFVQLDRSAFQLSSLLRMAWKLFLLGRRGQSASAKMSLQNEQFLPFQPEGQLHEANRDKQAVQFHYDLSNEFYRLWLDKRMVYSCAYFEDSGESLDVAQEHKLERICRKLELAPGEHLLDIGCGFGGLMTHAISEYGALATGISLSDAQTSEARRQFGLHNVEERARINIVHYEEFNPAKQFDKIASVGMFEHVGQEKLGTYFDKVFSLLKPGGLFLLQGGATRVDRAHIGNKWMDRLGRGRNAFMQKYGFPDSRVIDIPEVLKRAERAGFETRAVESLREHYPLTLRRWLQRLDNNREKAVEMAGETAFRAWRLMFAGYIFLLEKGDLNEYQTLFSKPASP